MGLAALLLAQRTMFELMHPPLPAPATLVLEATAPAPFRVELLATSVATRTTPGCWSWGGPKHERSPAVRTHEVGAARAGEMLKATVPFGTPAKGYLGLCDDAHAQLSLRLVTPSGFDGRVVLRPSGDAPPLGKEATIVCRVTTVLSCTLPGVANQGPYAVFRPTETSLKLTIRFEGALAKNLAEGRNHTDRDEHAARRGEDLAKACAAATADLGFKCARLGDALLDDGDRAGAGRAYARGCKLHVNNCVEHATFLLHEGRTKEGLAALTSLCQKTPEACRRPLGLAKTFGTPQDVEALLALYAKGPHTRCDGGFPELTMAGMKPDELNAFVGRCLQLKKGG